MREKLEKIGEQERHTFVGTFVKKGRKRGFTGPEETIMLKDVKVLNGKVLTDHLWFNLTKGFKDANLNKGDVVQFDARVKGYLKGYFGHKEYVDAPISFDFKLSMPTKIKVISRKRDKQKR